jgi:P27 family predicted phage terminase small subunit
LRAVEGNPGHRPIPGSGPSSTDGGDGGGKKLRADTVRPTCPKELSKEAKKEWRRLVPILEELGLLGRTDRGHLAAYCASFARFIEAEGHLDKEGSILKTDAGAQHENPWSWVSKREREMMRQLGNDMCLTAIGRVRANIIMEVPQKQLRERLASS